MLGIKAFQVPYIISEEGKDSNYLYTLISLGIRVKISEVATKRIQTRHRKLPNY